MSRVERHRARREGQITGIGKDDLIEKDFRDSPMVDLKDSVKPRRSKKYEESNFRVVEKYIDIDKHNNAKVDSLPTSDISEFKKHKELFNIEDEFEKIANSNNEENKEDTQFKIINSLSDSKNNAFDEVKEADEESVSRIAQEYEKIKEKLNFSKDKKSDDVLVSEESLDSLSEYDKLHDKNNLDDYEEIKKNIMMSNNTGEMKKTMIDEENISKRVRDDSFDDVYDNRDRYMVIILVILIIIIVVLGVVFLRNMVSS